MSDKKPEKSRKPHTGVWLVLPFFVILAVLTVVALILPLRPTQSDTERRNLAEFPEFSVSALLSGSYFDDISIWFADTFPGREQWLALSSDIDSLHGSSEISIQQGAPMTDLLFQSGATEPTEAPSTESIPVSEPSAETDPVQESQPTEPTQTESGWGGIDAETNDITVYSTIIQIGDAAFNSLTYSPSQSGRYSRIITSFADMFADKGIRVVSAPCPTAIGVLVEPEYLDKLGCSRQDEMIQALHDSMGDSVIKVDTFQTLVAHNSEYIYFRTDHHWTALGAYYAYCAICQALGMEPAPLSSFEEWSQGTFQGTLYRQVSHPDKLRLDEVIAYIPPGEISMKVFANQDYGYELPMLADTSGKKLSEKYLTFISGDNPLSLITNESLPEDAPSCLLIKDSYGNCLAPFFTQNYRNVYVLDYRAFHQMTFTYFVKTHDVQDVIFVPYLIAIQAEDGVDIFNGMCSK